MCSPTASVGLTQDQGGSEAGVGSTASHELGHIMSMNHDDARKSSKGIVEFGHVISLPLTPNAE